MCVPHDAGRGNRIGGLEWGGKAHQSPLRVADRLGMPLATCHDFALPYPLSGTDTCIISLGADTLLPAMRSLGLSLSGILHVLALQLEVGLKLAEFGMASFVLKMGLTAFFFKTLPQAHKTGRGNKMVIILPDNYSVLPGLAGSRGGPSRVGEECKRGRFQGPQKSGKEEFVHHPDLSPWIGSAGLHWGF